MGPRPSVLAHRRIKRFLLLVDLTSSGCRGQERRISYGCPPSIYSGAGPYILHLILYNFINFKVFNEIISEVLILIEVVCYQLNVMLSCVFCENI